MSILWLSCFLLLAVLPIIATFLSDREFKLTKNDLKKLLVTDKKDRSPAIGGNYYLRSLFGKPVQRLVGEISCDACTAFVNLMVLRRQLGLSRERMAAEFKFLCSFFRIESTRVCNGVIDLNIDVFLYMIDNDPEAVQDRSCGTIFQSLGCTRNHAINWSVKLPEGNSSPRKESQHAPDIKILHLSDIHYDPYYTPNGNTMCGEPMCCQEDQGEPNLGNRGCGYWTEYKDADVPWHLVEETIRQTKTQKWDYVYYTGDIVSHRIWDTSISRNTETILKLNNFFKKSFNVPVYPVLGNHETHPLDLWTPKEVTDKKFSNQWLFELVAEQWSQLVGEDIKETVLKGGYYTVSPKPGFRIIAINSNVCYIYNFWLILADVDPYGQLQWLADTLKLAEDNNESVHILSHVPAGSEECLGIWGREYNRIVTRFSNTITGQFNGHTHIDQFYLYYNDSKLNQPVGAAFNGASVTPFTLSNPSYKIFDVNGKTFELKDYEEWTFNLSLANSGSRPQTPRWYKLYSFTHAYGVNSLHHNNVHRVVLKMARNKTVRENYFRFQHRNSDPGIKEGCNDDCQKHNLCQIVTTSLGKNENCHTLIDLYEKNSRN